MTRNSKLLIAVIVFVSTAGCSFNMSAANAANGGQDGNSGTTPPINAAKPTRAGAEIESPTVTQKGTAQSCGDPKLSGKVFIKSQTFPLDFMPFAGGCFVTFASGDDMVNEKDVPRGSTFHVFKDGKKIFDFPDAFGGQAGCWIEGVSFTDLNGDGLTDTIIAGRCLGAKDSYPSNAVYANDGKGFSTNDEANAMIEDLKTLKDIQAFVKKNPKIFF